MGGFAGERLRVLIADDHPSVRENLRYLLSAEDDLEVVGVARNGVDAVHLARELIPDVVILDEDMPGLDGLGVLRALRRDKLPTRVVFYTLDTAACDTARTEGAAACLAKDADPSLVLDAVRAAGVFLLRPSRPGSQEPRTKRVLIIDDDDTVREVLRESLASAGFATREAADGESALRAAVAFDPDVIVLDLVLPVMPGRDVLRAYRRLPNARAKVLTLSALPQAPAIAKELGCDAGFAKPFELADVVGAIRSLAEVGRATATG